MEGNDIIGGNWDEKEPSSHPAPPKKRKRKERKREGREGEEIQEKEEKEELGRRKDRMAGVRNGEEG